MIAYSNVPGVLVLRLDAPLFYANAAPVAEGVKRLAGAAEPVPHVDFALAEVCQPVLDAAARAGLLDTIGPDRVFHTIDEAVAALGGEPR